MIIDRSYSKLRSAEVSQDTPRFATDRPPGIPVRMDESQNLLFEDAESTTRRSALNVVHAAAQSIASFQTSYFKGYRSMRALTYTSSIPMIAELMATQQFEQFECIFGHGGILSREAAQILAFQSVVLDKLAGAIVGVKGLPD